MGLPVRKLVIHAMRPGDLDDVVEIERRSHPRPWSRQVFIEELAREWARLVVLRTTPERGGGAMLGFCNFWVVRDEIHILNLAVHPEHRRQGHASRLLDWIVGHALEQGARFMTLEVRRGNQAAIKLYRRHGFKPVAVRPNYYVEDSEDAIVMLAEATVRAAPRRGGDSEEEASK